MLTKNKYLEYKLLNISDLTIAKDYYISLQTLKRWKTKNGINNKKVTKYKYNKIMSLKRQGLRVYEIADELNLHRNTPTEIISKFEK